MQKSKILMSSRKYLLVAGPGQSAHSGRDGVSFEAPESAQPNPQIAHSFLRISVDDQVDLDSQSQTSDRQHHQHKMIETYRVSIACCKRGFDLSQSPSKNRLSADAKIDRSDQAQEIVVPPFGKTYFSEIHVHSPRTSPSLPAKSLSIFGLSDSSSTDEDTPDLISSEHSGAMTFESRAPTSSESTQSSPMLINAVSPEIKSEQESYLNETLEQDIYSRSEPTGSEMTQMPNKGSRTVSISNATPNDSKYIVVDRSVPTMQQIDWTRYPIPSPTAFIDLFRKLDWASKLPGPMESWSEQLKSLAFMMNSDPGPSLILWGGSRERCMIYNEACVGIFGSKHPAALGAKPEDLFAELWEHLLPGIEETNRGKATQLMDIRLPMERYGYLEETFWCVTDLPILGPTGNVLGCYCRFTGSTSSMLAERKMKMLLNLSEASASAIDLKDMWPKVLRAFENSDDTMPFTAVYSVINGQSPTSSLRSTPLDSPQDKDRFCVLESSIGILNEHLPRNLRLSDCDEYLSPQFKRAWKTNEPVFLKDEDGTLPEHLRHSVPNRSWGDSCKAAVICPVRFVRGHHLLAFVVLGLNPRRPFAE